MPRKSSVPSLASGVARPCALVRVSSEEQVDQFSLPMQVHKIEEYCHQQLDAELPESNRPYSVKRGSAVDLELSRNVPGCQLQLKPASLAATLIWWCTSLIG